MSKEVPDIIKATMVTSGEDIGRVKDKDLAYDVAYTMHYNMKNYNMRRLRDFYDPYSPIETPNGSHVVQTTGDPFRVRTHDEWVKEELIRRSIRGLTSQMGRAIIRVTLDPEYSVRRAGRTKDEYLRRRLGQVCDEAQEVSDAYDELRAASRSLQYEDNARVARYPRIDPLMRRFYY